VSGCHQQDEGDIAGAWGAALQAYYDLIKLFRKGTVLSTTTTWVFLAGPAVGIVTTLLAALLIPLGGHAAPIAFDGDFVLMAYVLGLGRFFTIAAALDTGSAFEGMGGAREATFSCLAEPALLGFLGSRERWVVLPSGMLMQSVAATWSVAGRAGCCCGELVLVLLAENCRIDWMTPIRISNSQ
jgi:hypothetical protein